MFSTSCESNRSEDPGVSTSGHSFSDDDIQKLATALVSKTQAPKHFRLLDFFLGILFACFMGWLIYRRRLKRLHHRAQEKDAVELVRNMDEKTMKKILGDSHLPSWINFPDYERVGWINKVLEQLWPFINSSVSAQFREMLAPLLRENKPAWIASLKLFRFDLGEVAPHANGIKVYNQDTDDKDQILMDVDFSWVGEQDVQLQIKPLPKHLGPLSPAGALLSAIVRLRAGIERITINGRARFAWRPLMEDLPIIGGMQVALVEMPTFSFDVTLYGGDVSIVPGLEAWLTDFMKETVFRPYILPEHYWYPFSDAAKEGTMRPQAVLLVKAVKATNVPKMDLLSASDPYLRMFLRNGRQVRTATKENNANPVWDEEFKFMVHETSTQKLICILMDYDETNPDDCIGRCELPIRDLEPTKTKEYWLDIDMAASLSDAPESNTKNAGPIDTLIAAEHKVADKVDTVWKKLPGVRRDGDHKCQICLHVEDLLGDWKDQTDKPFETPPREQSLGRGTDTEDHQISDGTEEQAEQQGDRDDQQVNGHLQDKPNRGSALDLDRSGAGQDSEPESRDQVQSPGSESGTEKENAASETERGSNDEAEEVGEEAQEIARDVHKPGNEAEKEKERQAPKIRGRTVKHAEEMELKEKVKDALRGGILEIRPKKGIDLVRKPWYKASFLKSAAQLEVSVCGQFRRTASVPGSQPVFNEEVSFVLGRPPLQTSLRSSKLNSCMSLSWEPFPPPPSHSVLDQFRWACRRERPSER